MKTLTMAVSTNLFYFIAAASQGLFLLKQFSRYRWVPRLIGVTALLLQAIVLYLTIDTVHGQNLTAFNLLSLITWLVAVVVLVTSFYRPVDNLLLFIFPLAGILTLLACLFPGQNFIATGNNHHQLIHILLSILAFSFFCVAGFQALVLACLDHRLRKKRSTGWTNVLPSMETMEVLLFQFIAVGFVLLSASLVTSLWFFYSSLTGLLLNKTILAVTSWILFAVLLYGRYRYHWRGTFVIRATLVGIVLLLVCCLALA